MMMEATDRLAEVTVPDEPRPNPGHVQDPRINAVRGQLESAIAAYGSVVVGFSAGVDSSVVAVASARALGRDAIAVTAVTETITPEDVALAESLAARFGMRHEFVDYSELAIPSYAENPTNRCYYCKDALYARLHEVARERGVACVLDGTNADDAHDYRPGRQAAAEHTVRSPLLELGISKADVRLLALSYGLANHDRPSAPCLSSRVPYGTAITREILEQVARSERALRAMGFGELRVRHHGDVARVELPPHDFPRAVEQAAHINHALMEAGYRYVALDLRGFRSGSLNETLTQIQIPRI